MHRGVQIHVRKLVVDAFRTEEYAGEGAIRPNAGEDYGTVVDRTGNTGEIVGKGVGAFGGGGVFDVHFLGFGECRFESFSGVLILKQVFAGLIKKRFYWLITGKGRWKRKALFLGE